MAMVLTEQEFEAILSNVKAQERSLIYSRAYDEGGAVCGWYVQVEFEADGQVHHGRKWYVSHFSVPGEIVQTCLKAVLTSLEHECREHFTYKGVRVLAPHFDLDWLVKNAEHAQRGRGDPECNVGI